MEENQDAIKITYAKNLSKINFNSTINVNIDSNVNIKTILDIDSFIYDKKVESGKGKAVISGKLGVKVLYIDTDNITNTITDSQTFSENIVDSSITNDCIINLTNASIVNNVLSHDGPLKINCEISLSPVVYLNIGIANKASSFDNMVLKKSEINTSTISGKVDTSFEYTTNFETRDNISKILCYNAYFCPISTSATDGGAIVEGKLYSKLIYETNDGENIKIKELNDIFNVKTEINLPFVERDCMLDLTFEINKSMTNINTDFEEGNSIVTITHTIQLCGVSIKNISIDVVDDMYSTENEIELSTTKRDYNKNVQTELITDNISGEITLNSNEPAIDEIISNCNINAEITNNYLKDGYLILEGIISSHLIYIDENKEYVQKHLELPFVINTNIELDGLDCLHSQIDIVDCKTKVKRGTIIELDYAVQICLHIYQKDSRDIIDNFTLGKPLDFSNFDFQIFLAKPNESLWELCKRIRIAPEEISKYNKDLPLVMEGGEKVIIKR